MVPAPPPVQDIDGAIEEMWASSTSEIVRIDPATENWKTQVLPLARIKKIMKSEEAVHAELERDRQQQQELASGAVATTGVPNTRFMIAGEAPVLLGKACELLIKELTVRAWRHTERNRRRTLQRQDMHAAVGESEVYDFLIDIVPRITTTTATAQKAFGTTGVTSADAPSVGTLNAFGGVPHTTNGPPAPGVPAFPPGSSVDNNAMSLSDAEARYASLLQVQEHMQDQYNAATAQTSGADPSSVGVHQAAVPQAAAPPTQPQTVVMNPAFNIQGPDAPLQNIGQWGAETAPDSGNNVQPSAPAPSI